MKHTWKAIGLYLVIISMTLSAAALNMGAMKLLAYVHKHWG